MEKKFSTTNWIAAIALAVVLSALLTLQITSSYLGNKHKEELAAAYESVAGYEKFVEADQLFRSLYIKDIDEEELMDGILAGYVYGSGDKYAAYYPADEFEQYMEDLSGDTQGIGVSVIFNAEYNAIEVISVMPESPALEAGVLPGDIVVYVGLGDDAELVAELGYYGALAKLQGKAGTTAEFTVARGANLTEYVDFSIERGYVKEMTVTSHVDALDPTVGIVKITSFDLGTPQQFADAFNGLIAEGCNKFVVDVRYNPGGELTSICAVLDPLLPKGPVIRTIDKTGKEETVYESDANALDVPIAVLVNESTASAAELFASALQDYGKGIIVGVQTYGKGSMQTVRQLSDGSAISVTYRYYCPPFSDNYDGVGVTPDIVVEMDEALKEKNIYKITDEEDNQLRAAVEALYN
ncbi:MAG: PDZ domain-containing protein [Clostridia bacterium]|nr:PDZ domain-containing protein [Clostridia bacterium]